MKFCIMNLIIARALLVVVILLRSTYGYEELLRLTPEELARIPKDALEDSTLEAPDLIRKYGYPVEKHVVQTEDGYILTMFRIPGKRYHSGGVGLPVFLMHGIVGSCADWIVGMPENGLAFILADEGYDVWMGNTRGTYYSRKHVSLDPNDRKFWMFDWHEMGMYDLPVMIDYVIENTGKKKIHYIGHSQGVTVFFVLCSSRPEYNDKILTMNALAPTIYISMYGRPLNRFEIGFTRVLQIIANSIGSVEILGKSDLLRRFIIKYCNEHSTLIEICLKYTYGENHEHFNKTLIPVIMGHYPAGAVTKQFIHYSQIAVSGEFKQFDYGAYENIILYGSRRPPKYRLDRITAPVALHYGSNDYFVSTQSVLKIQKEIGNVIGVYRVPRDSFNHVDFIVGTDAPMQVYNMVIHIMRMYE